MISSTKATKYSPQTATTKLRLVRVALATWCRALSAFSFSATATAEATSIGAAAADGDASSAVLTPLPDEARFRRARSRDVSRDVIAADFVTPRLQWPRVTVRGLGYDAFSGGGW